MKSVLIVEDDFYIRDIYSINFIQKGYRTDLAVDGQEALERIRKGNYDIILLDIMLPKMSGLDVLQTLKTENAFPQASIIVICTNLAEPEVLKQFSEMGVAGFLIKSSFTANEIVQEVEKIYSQHNPQVTTDTPTS